MNDTVFSRENLLLTLAYAIPTAAVLLASLALGGEGVISSDARLYISVGDAFWSGQGLLDIDGTMFNAHGPVAPLLFSAIYYLLGIGALKTFTVLALLAAMLLTVWIANRLSGQKAALLASLSFLLLGFLWTEMDKVSVDNLQALLVIGIVALLLRPTGRNFFLAGALLGLMLLTKETTMLIALLPLVWLGRLGREVFWKRYGFFVGAAALVAGWWWIVVYLQEGIVFPLQQVEKAGGSYSTSTLSLLAFALSIPLWIAFTTKFWKSTQARVISGAAGAVFPPTFLSFLQGMDERQFIVFSLLAGLMFGLYFSAILETRRQLVLATILTPAFFLLPIQATNSSSYYIADPETIQGARVLEQVSSTWQQHSVFATLPNGVMADVRNMAYRTKTPVFPRPLEVKTCVSSWNKQEINRLRMRLMRSPKIWLVTRMPALVKAVHDMPGLRILWTGKQEKISLLQVKRELLPGKRVFLKKFRRGWMEERPCQFLLANQPGVLDYFRERPSRSNAQRSLSDLSRR